MDDLAFALRNISKRFAGVKANSDVTIEAKRGLIHGIVGENGAGKSTAMKILYGLYEPDSGFIEVEGHRAPISSPQRAIELGIGMVHQHFMLVPTFEVWQNIILGDERSHLLTKRRALKVLLPLVENYGIRMDLGAVTEELSVGERQQIEILKLLYRKSRTLILDEPTAVLTPQEADKLFERLKALKEQQCTIVVITHKLREVLKYTDTVTVMRHGKVVGSQRTMSLSESDLAEMIIGRKRRPPERRKIQVNADPVLFMENVTSKKLSKISLQVSSGEIVGVAGVEGNGQKELMECILGVLPAKGDLRVTGARIHRKFLRGARSLGVAIIPSDRLEEGLIPSFPAWENFILGQQNESWVSKCGVLKRGEIQAKTREAMEEFSVTPLKVGLPAKNFSGGNQQKMVVARECRGEPKFILAAHPTRGVDLGAMDFIHSVLFKQAEEGAAILVISSDLDELLTLCDRLVVLYDGKISGRAVSRDVDARQLGLWMTGVA